jgi:release factor glutamine methyltransferase
MFNIVTKYASKNTAILPKKHQSKVSSRAKNLIDLHQQHGGDYEIIFNDLKLQIIQEVFCPAYGEGTKQLASHMNIRQGERVLEIGTGSGALAILAAKNASSVIATDISPTAYSCAQQNIQRHELDRKVNIRQGDLFEPIGGDEKFSSILFNLPFMDGKPQSLLEVAMYDDGHATLAAFIQNSHRYLAENGRIIIAFSNAGNVSFLENQIHIAGFNARTLILETIDSLDFMLYELIL